MDSNELVSIEDLYADKPASPKERPAATDDGGLTQEQTADIAATADTVEDETKAALAPNKVSAPAKAKADPSDEDEPEPSDVVGLKAALKATRQKARERAKAVSDYEQRLAAETRRATELDGAARTMWAQLLGQPQRTQQQPQYEPPDANLYPAEALAYERAQVAAALQERDAKYEQDLYMARLVPSQRFMRKEHADYEEMEIVFKQAADADPRLWKALRQQEFPAEYAYNVAKELKQRQEIQEAGSFDKYVEKLVAKKMATAQPATPSVPTVPTNPASPKAPPPQSLARVPSVTSRTARAYNGPTPLNDLYK